MNYYVILSLSKKLIRTSMAKQAEQALPCTLIQNAAS